MPATDILIGRYRAQVYPDGSGDIFDVPVFAEVREGEKRGLTTIVDREWLLIAVAKDASRRAGGYAAPVHEFHHDAGKETRRAGFLRLNSVREFEYEGDKRWTIFADLVAVPADVFERIRRLELPYRSAEVASYKNPEIGSLALLSDEVPHFRFPLLTVRLGSTPEALERVTERFASTGPVLAATHFAADRGAYLFRFEDKPMDEEKKPKDEEPEIKAEAATPAEKGEDPAKDEDEKGSPVEKMEEKSEGETGAEQAEAELPPEQEEIEKAQDAKMSEILDGINKLLRLLMPMDKSAPSAQPNTGADPADVNKTAEFSAEKKPEEQPTHPAIADIPEEPKPETKPEGQSEQFADIRGELAALKAKDAARALVEDAKATLRGYPITREVEADIAHFAALGKDHLDRFVSSFKRSAVPDGPRNLAELERSSTVAKDSPEVAKFAAEGFPSEAITVAREIAAEYDGFVARGIRMPMTREQYLAASPRIREFAAAK